jgi:lysylphosphatidylglycerol synthetase-like protein (DUF2156 family)
LTGGSVVFGLSSLAMATVGLLPTRRLIPRAKRAGNFSRGSQTRTLNIAFASISAGAYSAQLGLALVLLVHTQSAALQRAWSFVIVALYCSALVGHGWSPGYSGACLAALPRWSLALISSRRRRLRRRLNRQFRQP